MEEIGGKFIVNYECQQKIGLCYFSSVYKAIHQPTMLVVAIKIINKDIFVQTREKKIFSISLKY
jgi:serine/threonine protein kinase